MRSSKTREAGACWLCWLGRVESLGNRFRRSRSRSRNECRRNKECGNGDRYSGLKKIVEFGVEAFAGFDIGKMGGVEFHVARAGDVVREVAAVSWSGRGVVRSGNY